ncbi:MAG: DUF5615 family PIN-like protein [Ignavibacteriales bacterium]|nr:DUF5615 family PIN-like protein [Ignavibacteriales bacterium]
MAIHFYMDVHIPRAITNGLRLRKIDVLTAHEDGTILLTDEKLLERAAHLNRTLFTFDDDLLKIASANIDSGKEFSGLVFAHLLGITIGVCIQDLEIISNVLEIEEMRNQIIFLPI